MSNHQPKSFQITAGEARRLAASGVTTHYSLLATHYSLLFMNHLHAYWRMPYIEAPRARKAKRPFTDLPALGDDRAALIVHRAPLSYLMLNRYPYNPGHLLAIPNREVTDIEALTPDEAADLFRTITFAKKLLRLTLKPDAYNIGLNLGTASGGSIPHLHAHIVPRWTGDTNFMPVVAETKVLPQSLETLWEKLHAKAKKIQK